jgi:hypothetical protein
MDATGKLIIIIIILVLVAAIYGLSRSKRVIEENIFMDRHLMKRGQEKPVLWLYYDTSDVNSQWWYDFGGRSSRALNKPFLNLCYETIVIQNKNTYRIEVINGLAGLASLLGLDAMPSGLKNMIAPVNEAELTWIRAAVLAKFGGLWLDPYSVCIKPFGPLDPKTVVFYGTDLNETYGGKEGTVVPGFRCIWSGVPAHPLFVEWAEIAKARLEAKGGGQQIRRDANWDWVSLSSKYDGLVVDYAAEGGRKQGGKRLELEDILASGTEGKLPFPVPPTTVYIPVLWPELRDREIFGWFLRMSEDQIMESDIAVRHLIDRGLLMPYIPPREEVIVVTV